MFTIRVDKEVPGEKRAILNLQNRPEVLSVNKETEDHEYIWYNVSLMPGVTTKQIDALETIIAGITCSYTRHDSADS